MNPERFARVKEVLLTALAYPPAERQAYLGQACAGDPDLQAEVEALLEREGRTAPEVRTGALADLAARALDEAGRGDLRVLLGSEDSDSPGDSTSATASQNRIGPYLLRRVLGEGGMGIVWEAEQEEPVRRRVALKCMRIGFDSSQFLARFESERQALALMSHPNIARAFDAGATAAGQPYYAMEIVEGPWITTYCAAQRLDIRRRLELFLEVCQGIQHAHQRGVIHRDIKPSNILVQIDEGRPVPKIIDFGVAKAMGAVLTERTLVTRVGQAVGTPEYMSPEQADPAGFDVDTRTDVYSLGTLLYELLTGSLPFRSVNGDLDDLRRRIREEEPVRPSARIAALGPAAARAASERGLEAGPLIKVLRGDLDWIVLKALAKDRARRYATPDELAAEVRRFLGNEPVLAGPPSAIYRTRKFVRRHRFGVTAAAVSIFGLLAFGVTMTLQARRIARERDRANLEAAKATKVSEFLVDLFSSIDPARAKGKEVTVREVLDIGREKIHDELGSHPELQVPLMTTLGRVYRELGVYEPAQQLLEEAALKSRDLDGPDGRETFRTLAHLTWTYFRAGKGKKAQPMAEENFSRSRAVFGDDDKMTLQLMLDLGVIDFNVGRDEEAEKLLREALERFRRVFGPEHPQTLLAMNGLSYTLGHLNRYPEAESLARQALEAQRRVLGADHPETPHTLDNLAEILSATGRYAEAEQAHREAYEIRRRVLGEEHSLTLGSLDGVASALINQQKFEEGGALERKIADILGKTLGPDNPGTLGAREGVALAEDAAGRHEEARAILVDLQTRYERVFGPDHQLTMMNQSNLAIVLAHLGRFAEAESMERKTLEVGRGFGPSNLTTRRALHGLADIAALRRRRQEAVDYVRQAQAAGEPFADLLADQDLKSLSGDPEFEQLIAALKKPSDAH